MILTEEVPLLAAPTHQLYQQNQLQYSDEDQRFFSGKEKENKNKHICKQALNTSREKEAYLNQFSNHHSFVDSSAHGFQRNFIRSFFLFKET